jgi:hypothetical protein
MNIEDLESEFARLKYRVGLLEEHGGAPLWTAKLKVAVRDTIEILQKWVKDKGDCLLSEDNPDYREVCSTLPMLEAAYTEYLRQPGVVRGHTRDLVMLDEANFRHVRSDDFVIIVSRPWPVDDGKWTYLTHAPDVWTELKAQELLWGKNENDAKVGMRAWAEKMIAPMHGLYRRAPGSFCILPLRQGQHKINYDAPASFAHLGEAEQDKMAMHGDRGDFPGRSVPPKLDVSEMVNAFLAWPLPASVCCDHCAHIQGHPHRIGTSLLTADEARQMFEYVLNKAQIVGSPQWIEILLNGTMYRVPNHALSYEDIVKFVDPDFYKKHKSQPGEPMPPWHTITYRHRTKVMFPGSGSLTPGQEVVPTSNMIIDAVVCSAA